MPIVALICALAFVHGPASRVGDSRAATSAPPSRARVAMARGQPPGFMNPQKQGGPPPMPDDGIPAFTLFVRSPQIGMWYPVSILKGDKPTRALVDAIANNGLGADMAKAQLNEGLAKSIFAPAQLKQLEAGVLKQYKALKSAKDSLEWGYKVQDRYLAQKVKDGTIEEPKITKLTVDMTADRVDQVQNAVSKTVNNVWKAVSNTFSTTSGEESESK